MDLDLLGFGSPEVSRLVRVFREIVAIPVPDGIEFLPETFKAAPIREDAVYDGVRVTIEARLAAARIHLQVDVGFGDAVSPAPRETSYPTLLDAPPPVLRAYPREAVVAEKLHAMVDLGLANSRMKDFFDLWFLATKFSSTGNLSTGRLDSGLLSSMRATFAPGGTGGLQSDPALEPSEVGGHTLLQRRLSLYGKVLVAQSILYWLIYAIIWGPTVGFKQSLGHIASWDVVLLTAIYSLYWIAARGRARSAAVLLATDVGGSLAIGIDNVFLMLGDLGTISGIFENLIGFICILLLRSLIVPSTVKRTLLCGLLMCGPTILGVALGPHRFDDQTLSWITMVGFSINWSVIALIFSGVASAVLYGLRREVRDARRLGQYTLGEKLGEGGMGVVYRASHAMLRRPTAIKLLADGGDGSLARFEQEVQLLAGLNHPNIVTVHDYGRTADGSFYYAMELLDGMDLEKLVAADGPQPPERVIHIVRQAARGLDEAHDLGLVHRDIKPANVFVCRRWGEPDAVKVLDFGLAKNNAAPPTSVTGQHVVLGTPLYISPEALKGSALADVRSDIYSLGAVAYYMLTAEPVFTGGSVIEVCAKHLHSAPVVPSERLGRAVPADLEAIVLRCLAKSPGDRYATAAELERALAACAAASEWSTDRARAWWKLRGGASTPAREDDGEGRTVEIDPGTRQAALRGALALPIARRRE